MIININSLTESLDRKLQESHSLNEKFNSSFPDWLKRRIIVTKDSSNYQKAKNIPYTDRPAYINARDDKYDNYESKSLFQKALAAGIDFEETNVIEGPIPEKRTDPRLKEPNIPVWYFAGATEGSSGQVYIEGLNDNEIYRPFDRAFKYMPMKDKLANATAFAYIDGKTLKPEAYAELKQNRRERDKELRKIPNYTRKGTDEYDRFGKSGSWNSRVDKSGYIIDPARYEGALRRLAGKKVYQELQNMHDTIVDAKRKVLDAYSVIDPFDTNNDDSEYLRNILNDVGRAARYYNDYMRQVENIVNDPSYDEEHKQFALGRVVDNIKTNSYIRNIKEKGSNYFLQDIDWD